MCKVRRYKTLGIVLYLIALRALKNFFYIMAKGNISEDT